MHTTKGEEEERKSTGNQTCLLVDRDLIAKKTSGHFNKTSEQSKKKGKQENQLMFAATNFECQAAVCCQGVALFVAATERETPHLAAITKGKTTGWCTCHSDGNGANPPGQFRWPGKSSRVLHCQKHFCCRQSKGVSGTATVNEMQRLILHFRDRRPSCFSG